MARVKKLVVRPAIYEAIVASEEIGRRYGFVSPEKKEADRRLYAHLPPRVFVCLDRNGAVKASRYDIADGEWYPIPLEVRDWVPNHPYGEEEYVFLAEGARIKVVIEWDDDRWKRGSSYLVWDAPRGLPQVDFFTQQGENWVVDDVATFKNPTAVMRKVMRMIAKRLKKGQVYQYVPADEKRSRIYGKMFRKFGGVDIQPAPHGYFRIKI